MNEIVKDSVVTATCSAGDNLALVRFTDGTLGITRNDHPIGEWFWQLDEIDDAILTFLLIADLNFHI